MGIDRWSDGQMCMCRAAGKYRYEDDYECYEISL
jgi:hypothetical protein